MLPIVFIHKNYQSYLEFTLRQCILSNPGSPVFLLGDDASLNRLSFVDHVPIRSLAGASTEFEAVYQHRSTNPVWYELLCFQRWFYVLELMRTRQLEEVFVSDSDVMIFRELGRYPGWTDRLPDRTAAFCITHHATAVPYAWEASAHSSYWTRAGLEDFCRFLTETYRNHSEPLETKWRYQQDNGLPGGISDMALLFLYAERHPEKVVNLLEPVTPPGGNLPEVFDLNISLGYNLEDDEFAPDGRGLKAIRREDGAILAENKVLKRTCRLNTLHFQGTAKYFIHQYYQGSDLRLRQFGQSVYQWLGPVIGGPVRNLKSRLKRYLNGTPALL
ncbi:hypothetical protein [Larkinella soli]|uniref:hypothetical protein n=1 Tax=Larkinella soli TaxID=1770527 RepID=UPI000FFC4CC6|nr:hypothetical protein [Larkinella soli]